MLCWWCRCAGRAHPVSSSHYLSIKMDAPSKSCKIILTEFIAIYRDLPQLWDTKYVGYSNRKIREEGYVIFLNRFRPTCPAITIKEIKSKINTVRTNFRRELKKVKDSGYTYTSSLWYFENLRFLEYHLGTTAQQNLELKNLKLFNNTGNPFNFKITNVGSSSNLDLSDSNVEQSSSIGTNNEGKANRNRNRNLKVNHDYDPEISSTNKPDNSLEEKETDDSIELPPILSVKVEIPSSPEPYHPENQTPKSKTPEPIQPPPQPINKPTLAPNPLILRSKSLRQHQQRNHLKRILEAPSQPTSAPIPKRHRLPTQQKPPTENNELLETSEQNQTECQKNEPKISPKPKFRKNKKKGHHYDKELLNTVRTHFKEKEEEVDLLAQAWALKLKRLQPDQRIFAEKFIGDIFMEAELGTLNRTSIQINI